PNIRMAKLLRKQADYSCGSYGPRLLVVGRPPLRRRAEPRLKDLHDLALGGEPIEASLAEDFLTVDVDLKTASASSLQLEPAQDRCPSVEQLLSQAHGLG